jgi:hypothetical protein
LEKSAHTFHVRWEISVEAEQVVHDTNSVDLIGERHICTAVKFVARATKPH